MGHEVRWSWLCRHGYAALCRQIFFGLDVINYSIYSNEIKYKFYYEQMNNIFAKRIKNSKKLEVIRETHLHNQSYKVVCLVDNSRRF